VVPSRSPKTSGVFTAGGYVRDPIRGFYNYPLATLDFSSLYPSIMQAYNICYSTVESLAWAKANLSPDDYWIVPPLDGKTPNDFVFVKKHIREGVLPMLLTALLGQRAYVKNLMKKVDPVTQKSYYNVLDGRQLALKVVCNSVYGFLKAFILTDPRLMAAVTAYGRDMIIDTATTIETHYKGNMIVDRVACEALGMDYEQEPAEGEVDPRPRKAYDARIIYGDTGNLFFNGPLRLTRIYVRGGWECLASFT
jgi:DNA polymerase delta subunit 1